MTRLHNLAIIAHVDHGKTTMVDQLLRQSGSFRANQQVAERVMDSNDLERERGITILAKCTSVAWKEDRLNIVDTPGHADFGGEVERILSMVDGVVVLVDAAEGPMPQTKFVTMKALALGLRPIVVINKVDRPDARPHEVHDMVFDLFAALGATDEQLDFPTLFASSKLGWAVADLADEKVDMTPLFDLIVKHVPPAEGDATAPFAMLTTTLEYDSYLGRVLTGRIHTGTAKVNMHVKSIAPDGRVIEHARLSKLLAFRGIERVSIESAEAGDIIAIAGLEHTTVADTICEPEMITPIDSTPVDPPTLSMTVSVNDSPLGGPRRRQGDEPHDPGPALPRIGRQCRHQGARERGQGCLRGRRPRRAAAGRADRADAPRGLRALGRPAARHLPPGSRRRASGWSPSRRSRSTSTTSIPASWSSSWACAAASSSTCGPRAGRRRA